MAASPPPEPADARIRILIAAARLVASGGGDAATTRAIAAAAGVQAPTIYRLFGDKNGLLAAVAEQVMADFVANKIPRDSDRDPIIDLRLGWDDYVAFGLANPAVFTMITVGAVGGMSSAAAAGLAVLRARVNRVARIGRLRVSEGQAADLIHAGGTGAVLALLAKPADARGDLAIQMREAVMAAILDGNSATTHTTATMATGLRARLEDMPVLSPGERHLIKELLERLSRASG